MIRIIHFGIHKIENKNSGDTVLFKLTQKLFNKFQNNIEWTNKNLWEPIDEDDINKINTNFDFILIGGGGLLLIDQKGAENSKSGWQFNCSTPLIKKISIRFMKKTMDSLIKRLMMPFIKPSQTNQLLKKKLWKY